ncbi:MAG: LLM class flavin-dependent oxidoreductase [Candidatus Bathyarchaeota archaeon]|nr:LLM class flavin-dependent oxidoreductase [Candidatus Bathyarchaeota archaeon]
MWVVEVDGYSGSSSIEFGVNFATYGFPSFSFLLESSIRAERIGFDALWVLDHLFLPDRIYRAIGEVSGRRDALDAWIVMAAMATVTRSIRIGSCVTPIPLRNPPLLAKTVATLDSLSNGRIIFGVGAGWFSEEFRRYGIRWDRFQVRVAKTIEGVTVIKKLWTEDSPSYSGRFYRIIEAPLWPKPVQKPHPPIFFGGRSEAILKAVAEMGDGWISWAVSSNEFREKVSMIRDMARRIGRKPETVKPACNLIVSISEDYDEARKIAERYVANFFGKHLDEVGDFVVYGGVDDCIDGIERFIEAGAVHVAFRPMLNRDIPRFLDIFGEKVIPYFK